MPQAPRTEALAASEPGQVASEPQGAAVATEAEGLHLHLSSRSSTGYKCVCRHSSGRFEAKRSVAGRLVSLGYFSTRRWRLRLPLRGLSASTSLQLLQQWLQRRRACACTSLDTAVEAAVAYARHVGEYQPPAPPAVTSSQEAPAVVTEAEILRLHLSSSNSTG